MSKTDKDLPWWVQSAQAVHNPDDAMHARGCPHSLDHTTYSYRRS